MILKTLLLFLGLAAAVYVCLIRDRGWRAAHFSRRARTAYFAICISIAGGAAGALALELEDEIQCPAGYGEPELRAARLSTGKGGSKVRCHDGEGHTKDGSWFAGLFAVLGMAVLAFAGASAVWRMFGPPTPPAEPTLPVPGAPTDKRERRRERKREDHRRRGG